MTHEEKAKELIKRMHLFSSGDSGKDDLTKANAKQCALIAVDEIVKSLKITTGWMTLDDTHCSELTQDFDYWNSVKESINKL